jgi:predicted phosphodiesterase
MAFVHSVKRALISSDHHQPYHHRANFAAMMAFARDFKPHVKVIAGDFNDFPEVSRHNRGSLALLEGRRVHLTCHSGNEVLDEIDAAVGRQCREKVFIFGNHDIRLEKWSHLGDNGVFQGDPMLDLAGRLRLEGRGYHVIRKYPKGVYSLGKLRIIHGQYCSKHAAATHVEKLGVNVMFGHTHRSGLYLAPTLDGQRGGYALGTMADPSQPELEYAGIAPGWSEGFGTVMVRRSGNFQAELHNFVDGVFYFGGRQYGKLRP